VRPSAIAFVLALPDKLVTLFSLVHEGPIPEELGSLPNATFMRFEENKLDGKNTQQQKQASCFLLS